MHRFSRKEQSFQWYKNNPAYREEWWWAVHYFASSSSLDHLRWTFSSAIIVFGNEK
jgi:hypothetical protein